MTSLNKNKEKLRGYIQPQGLQELWFHTGTTCNLQCPFCLEASSPGNTRIMPLQFQDAKPFLDEALELGVKQFSFTGGEPFVTKDIIKILSYALEHRPCLVLTNATKPLATRMDELIPLTTKPHPLNFRVSLDYPDPIAHDAGRGKGNFNLSLTTMAQLHAQGFNLSVARQCAKDENSDEVDRSYQLFFQKVGLPPNIRIIRFPDFLKPGITADVPYITEHCMTHYHTEESRNQFMCNNSKMILKENGKMCVYACTLVDDDPDYNLGNNLTESLRCRIMLKHHRCYSCFANGASCSEL